MKECPIKKGAFCFWGSVWVRVPSVPEKAVCRSFVFQLKSGPEKPRKRPIGCAFTRIQSKLTIIDGKGGHFRSAFAASRQKGGGVCRGTAPTGSNSLAFPVNRTKCQSILCCPVRNARLNKTVRFNINISHLTLTLLFLIVWFVLLLDAQFHQNSYFPPFLDYARFSFQRNVLS